MSQVLLSFPIRCSSDNFFSPFSKGLIMHLKEERLQCQYRLAVDSVLFKPACTGDLPLSLSLSDRNRTSSLILGLFFSYYRSRDAFLFLESQMMHLKEERYYDSSSCLSIVYHRDLPGVEIFSSFKLTAHFSYERVRYVPRWSASRDEDIFPAAAVAAAAVTHSNYHAHTPRPARLLHH